MSWNENDEKLWHELTRRREENKLEVGKIHTIKLLRDLADSMERGDDLSKNSTIDIEYLTDDGYFGYTGKRIIGKRISIYSPIEPGIEPEF